MFSPRANEPPLSALILVLRPISSSHAHIWRPRSRPSSRPLLSLPARGPRSRCREAPCREAPCLEAQRTSKESQEVSQSWRPLAPFRFAIPRGNDTLNACDQASIARPWHVAPREFRSLASWSGPSRRAPSAVLRNSSLARNNCMGSRQPRTLASHLAVWCDWLRCSGDSSATCRLPHCGFDRFPKRTDTAAHARRADGSSPLAAVVLASTHRPRNAIQSASTPCQIPLGWDRFARGRSILSLSSS